MSELRERSSLDQVLASAREWVPELRRGHREVEQRRQVSAASLQRLRDIGVLGLATPRELGGSDLGPDAIFDATVELGKGCGATAWCGGNWAIHNMLGAMFSEAARENLFSGGELPVISTGFSPLRAKTRAVDGGTVLTGQWDFVSGVDRAEWVVVAAIGEAGPLAHLLPISEVTVLDTWHTAGLRGTGSQDVTATEVFVPTARVVPLMQIVDGSPAAAQRFGSPFFGLPLGSYFGCGVLGSIIGIALGALDVFTERTIEKVGGISGMKVASRPEVPLRLGESSARIDAAHTVARATYADMRQAAESGRDVQLADRVRWRRDHAWAAKTAAGAVSQLYELGGAHVLFDDDLLQQFYRDINAGSHHYSISPDTLFGGWGRLMLGMDPQVAMV